MLYGLGRDVPLKTCQIMSQLVRLARTSEIGHPVNAHPAEPPCTDPYARWCGRGGGGPRGSPLSRLHLRQLPLKLDRLRQARRRSGKNAPRVPFRRPKTIEPTLGGAQGFDLGQRDASTSSRVEEGHLLSDHVHMLVPVPPKYSVAQVIGYIKGKSAIHIAREFEGRARNFVGQHFWARGYFVSTLSRDEQAIRASIQ